MLGLIGKDGALNKRKETAALLRTRVAECKEIITRYLAGLPTPPPILPPIVTAIAGLPTLPTPMPLPTAPASCQSLSTDDPVRAYVVLNFCSKWIARNVTSPPPVPSPTPQPLTIHTPIPGSSAAWNKIVYVLALAADAPTSAQIALQLASELRSRQLARSAVPDLYAPKLLVKYNIVAEPTWTLAQYQQQCFIDPSTAGAIVALQPSTQSASYNALFSASWTKVGLEAIVVDCEPTNTAYVNNASYITWI